MTTDRKWPIGNLMVMWPMALRVSKRSNSWPQCTWDQYLENSWRSYFNNNRYNC